MCGIAGFISDNPKYNSKKIVRDMLTMIRHRGPDQIGLYGSDNVMLGVARLNIIDKENHDIPYETFDKSTATVYNGEIYNHDSLRKNLKGKYPFKTKSDAETVLYCYLEKGIKSFNDYNGMYAFALYDNRKKELYIVRDKTGEKPLYYAETGSFFAFASEIKALLKLVKPVLNKACVSYDAYEFNTGEETLFQGIHNLMPGEYIKIDRALRVTKHVYWKIWDNLIDVPDNLKKIKSKQNLAILLLTPLN
jgi:asparagine synthase (glutamine-hydrolysing)